MIVQTVLTALAELFASGGFVMPWLLLANLALWYALGERAWLLRPGLLQRAERLVATLDASGRRQEALEPVYAALERHTVLVLTLTGIAPLIGLLGTVTGMIETFDSLTSMSLFRGSGGVAGGISAALVSTQMGLSVAIPGLLVGRLLDRRASRLRASLDALVTA